MKCLNCGKESDLRSNYLVSKFLGFCLDCIRNESGDHLFEKIKPKIEEVHQRSRKKFALPPRIPKAENGVRCKICANECLIPQGERGYCGLRKNVNSKLIHLAGTAQKGILDWYYDPLPTNCVAGWVCSGNKQYDKNNLAIFYRACTFNCLFCQNWHFRGTRIDTNRNHELTRMMSAEELANCVNENTYCVCFFGGDPAPQLPHALATSRKILERKMTPVTQQVSSATQPIRICWETNGSMNQNLLEEVAKITYQSGGCIKFDLKSYDEKLNFALCGVSNKRTLENFVYLANWIKNKEALGSQEPPCGGQPFLVASTLLIPGYIDAQEVYKIASFIGQLNPEIPYSLLAFYPQFFFSDLPVTTRKDAYECLEAAKKAGLKNVHLGNIRLLKVSE